MPISFDNGRPIARAFAPGRTEIAGNHTDHQGGRVIAATIAEGVTVRAQARADGLVTVESEGFPSVMLDLAEDRFSEPKEEERGTSKALVRGMAAGLTAAGLPVSGFSATVTSTLPEGGGLSSSAAFELALGAAMELLFGGQDGTAGHVYGLSGQAPGTARSPLDGKAVDGAERFAPVETPMTRLIAALQHGLDGAGHGAEPSAATERIADGARALAMARIAQAAERDYFGKPCGLMDQLAIATGGLLEIDFGRPGAPLADPIAFDFAKAGFDVCLVDTHADHSRFTREYAQVQLDMQAVAHLFGKDTLSQVPAGEFMGDLGRVRSELGDRCALRAMHYYNENNLVAIRAAALRAGDMGTFLDATRRSGASSAQYLQNVSVPGSREQPAMVALALADGVLGDAGAVRIHGGGFGGSVQAYVPCDATATFKGAMDGFLGEGSTHVLKLTKEGAHAEWE